jgi:GNAT superfamily N-acetyltransferase
MSIIIREGEEEDFPVIMGLIKDLATFEKAPHAVKNSVEQMRREKESFDFFVAEENGKILGTAIYFFAYYTWVGKSLYLDDLYVKPDSRGKKIGSMLLRKVFELAKQENCKRLRWQVLDWNKDAIALYEKCGAAISNEWLNCDFDEDGIKQFLKKNPR